MTVVYTDGACSGNPGPGGWAWAEVDGAWATGYEADTTNQRMELAAVVSAVETFDGELRIHSDSTYVVNCWKDRWWAGWLKRGWKNSQRKPVANRDLWEQLVPHFAERDNLELVWVKGHSGDRWNDIADRLAVAAVQNRSGASGSTPPTDADLGDPDQPTSGRVAVGPTAGSDEAAAGVVDSSEKTSGRRSAQARSRDGRVPDGFLVTVTGTGSSVVDRSLGELAGIIGAWAELQRETIVLTGLRSGAEALAASAAETAGVPYVVVLPYPDPAIAWPAAERELFGRRCESADSVVTLERSRPADPEGRRKALARRDGWLRGVSDVAVLLTGRNDSEAESSVRQWTKALGDDLWVLDRS